MENITVADSDPVNEQCLDDEFYPNIDLDNLDLKDIQFDKMKLPYLAYHSTLDRFLLPDYGKFNSFDELNFKIQEFIDARLEIILPDSNSTCLTSMLQKVIVLLEHFRLSDDEQIESFEIEQFQIVGSYRMKTMLRNCRTADISLILKTLPVKATLPIFGERLEKKLLKLESTNPISVTVKEYGFDVSDQFCNVRILIGTLSENYVHLDKEIHLKQNLVLKAKHAILHVSWFDCNVKDDKIHNLIIIMKDISKKFQSFKYINPWMLINLCHYAITKTYDSRPLSISMAFLRIIEILSNGFFLPYSTGIPDPLNPKLSVHAKLNVLSQERIAQEAQLMLRILNYNDGCKYVFMNDPDSSGNPFDIAQKIALFDNIVLSKYQSISALKDVCFKELFEDVPPNQELDPKDQELIKKFQDKFLE